MEQKCFPNQGPKPSDGFGAFKLVNVSARTNRVVVEAFISYHWNLEATIS